MNRCTHSWYADCLGVTAILAMSQDPRKLRKLARQFDLLEGNVEADGIEVFSKLHEACHHNAELAGIIAKDLNERFRTTSRRVRSLSLDRIKALEADWMLPLLWAVLNDDRDDVRLYGRYLIHRLLWEALRRGSETAEKDDRMRNAIESMEAQVRTQKAEAENLRREIQEKSAEIRKLQMLLKEKTCEQRRTTGSEGTGTNGPGNGRLARENRKLRHDLEIERRYTARLEQMPADSPVALPEAPGLKPSRKADPEVPKLCLSRSKGHSPDGVERLDRLDRCAVGAVGCTNGQGERIDCCLDCPLDGLRVAVVGGLSRMLPAYRNVVRQLGAEFLFHDGEVRSGSYKLKSVVCGADIIVFITSVNSHAALSVVKAVCRSNGKKFIVLKETGSKSLARTLRQCSA